MMRPSAGLHFALGLTVVILTSGYAEGACAAGWNHIGVRCYKYFGSEQQFTDAKKSCISEGAMLAKVHTQEVNDAVSEFVRDIGGTSEFWIGLTRTNDQNEWRWMDGASLIDDDGKWASNEPGSTENCAKIKVEADQNQKYFWFGYTCGHAYSYVCEKDLSTTPAPLSSPTGAANVSPTSDVENAKGMNGGEEEAETGKGNTDQGSDPIAGGPTKKLVKNGQSNSTPIEPSYKIPLLGALAAVAAIAVVLWIVALVLFIQRRKSLRNNPK